MHKQSVFTQIFKPPVVSEMFPQIGKQILDITFHTPHYGLHCPLHGDVVVEVEVGHGGSLKRCQIGNQHAPADPAVGFPLCSAKDPYTGGESGIRIQGVRVRG